MKVDHLSGFKLDSSGFSHCPLSGTETKPDVVFSGIKHEGSHFEECRACKVTLTGGWCTFQNGLLLDLC